MLQVRYRVSIALNHVERAGACHACVWIPSKEKWVRSHKGTREADSISCVSMWERTETRGDIRIRVRDRAAVSRGDEGVLDSAERSLGDAGVIQFVAVPL